MLDCHDERSALRRRGSLWRSPPCDGDAVRWRSVVFVSLGVDRIVRKRGLSHGSKGTAQAEAVGVAAPRGAISRAVGIGLASCCLDEPAPRASLVSRACVVLVALSLLLPLLCRYDSNEPSS